MHVKTLVFDRKVLLTGSVNLTHNGMENNKEHLYRISDSQLIAEVLADFEQVWASAEPVTQEVIADMMERHTKRASRPRSKSVSRSLSTELDDVRESSK